eukprot:TRINITY_DN5406_c0_g1_i1.p1 TRINITY_DN5406_c0_g1~~TRINITY_DN5406_c0_g1_i1.p1  ORF type:complete len:189 (-),score=37.83 TRINITY_DN5406_c0_g1_i1:20-586(-)
MNQPPVQDQPAASNRPRCFFDISANSEPLGRIVFELYTDIAPRTCENFRSLCTGEKGIGKCQVPLHYKGVKIHRCIENFAFQGGDITRGTGFGGESIYGAKFADENYNISHDSGGILTMANGGINCNGSQFIVTVIPAKWLDGKHVAFGHVVEGMDLVRSIVKNFGTRAGSIKDNGLIVVEDCGQIGE